MFGKKRDMDTRSILAGVLRRQKKQEHRLDEISRRVNYLNQVVAVHKREPG